MYDRWLIPQQGRRGSIPGSRRDAAAAWQVGWAVVLVLVYHREVRRCVAGRGR